ncbi:pleckstrin homology domain-containing family G member 4B [Latimeria chalumnae]|uniref:pleckstrin homology domain-containing family G member 4B n=1 Tax=Latimeria chalumnae TaxID=7897 RepID=UPI0006D9048F|nr:PREDICTED: pleckstrin homology domain-containing family G member 4B-like isoform X2 [Latimeria chalumnae]|eukprot:XP_014351349.1 PREDICTED: pleckstrin homology domain-containing family G member 4B-like isoform X2 [Latimeria chalumnae]
MDSESLDSCVQSTLSALYPPFEATAATVLCQVFDVVEKTYCGDGLRYLIDFLIPAKHILQCIQQDSCFQYCGLLFRHEGWPLCIHEKIVVHLASLNWRSLKPGDFYLQVVPYLKKTPRIVLKCLAKDRHNVEEIVVPEISYTSIFSMDWLDTINRERMGTALENCLLSTDDNIFRVPWEVIVHPEFIDKPKMIESMSSVKPTTEQQASLANTTSLNNQNKCNLMAINVVDDLVLGCQNLKEKGLNKDVLYIDRPTQQSEDAIENGINLSTSSDEVSESDLEGEYVELSEISVPRFFPQKGSLTQSVSLNYNTHYKARTNRSSEANRLVKDHDDSTCSKDWECLNYLQQESCIVPRSSYLQTLEDSNRTGEECKTFPDTQTTLNDRTSNNFADKDQDALTKVPFSPCHLKAADTSAKMQNDVDKYLDSVSVNQIGNCDLENRCQTKLLGTLFPPAHQKEVTHSQECREISEKDMKFSQSNNKSLLLTVEYSALSPPEEHDNVLKDATAKTEHSQQPSEKTECVGVSCQIMNESVVLSHAPNQVSEQIQLLPESSDTKFLKHHKVSEQTFDDKMKAQGIVCQIVKDSYASDYTIYAEDPVVDCTAISLPTDKEDHNLQFLESSHMPEDCMRLQAPHAVGNFIGDSDFTILANRLETENELFGAVTPNDQSDIAFVDMEEEEEGIINEHSLENVSHSVSFTGFFVNNESESSTEALADEKCITQAEKCLSSKNDLLSEVSGERNNMEATTKQKQGRHSGKEQCVECNGNEDNKRSTSNDVVSLESDERSVVEDTGLKCWIGQHTGKNDADEDSSDKQDKICNGRLHKGSSELSSTVNQQTEHAVACVDVTGMKSVSIGQDTVISASEMAIAACVSLVKAQQEGASGELTQKGEPPKTEEGKEKYKKKLLTQTEHVVAREERIVVKHQESLSFAPVPSSLPAVPTTVQDVNFDVLHSGVACLPGTRDKSGRAVVVITTRNTVWLNPHCNSNELVRLLMYFYSIARQESRALGLTVLVDARRCSPVPALFKAFNVVQYTISNCIHTVLLLAERDLTFRLEKPTSMQFELLTSLKSLYKHIDSAQLPLEFDGAFPYCHSDWLNFRMKLEQLVLGCRGAYVFLQSAIVSLESSTIPETAEDAGVLLERCRQLMKNVLEDTRLVRLQLEGGAILVRLKREESCVTLTDDYREAIDTVTVLYNQVDEGVHRLVMLSNKHMQELEFVIEFKAFEESFREVSSWIEDVGEKQLRTKSELDDSLEQLLRAQKEFKDFHAVAYEYCKRGHELLKKLEQWEELSSAQLQIYKEKLQTYRKQIKDFAGSVDECRTKIDKTVRLYDFFDKAYEWALEGMRHLACITMEDCNSPEKCGTVIKCLDGYKRQHPEIPEAKFQEMNELACELKSDKGIKQWKFAWSKCQETKLMFEKKLEAALRTRRSLPNDRKLTDGESPKSSSDNGAYITRRYSDGQEQRLQAERSNSISYSYSSPAHSTWWTRERLPSQSSISSYGAANNEVDENCMPEVVLGKSPTPSLFSVDTSPDTYRLIRSSSSEEPHHDYASDTQQSCYSTPVPGSQHRKRALRKAQSFDLPPTEGLRYSTCQRTLSEPARRGNTGVFIKGLEVSSTEIADRACASRQYVPYGWSSKYQTDGQSSSTPILEAKAKGSKLRHIIDEMVTTERDYVKSLRYIIDNYFPEMERFDLPQDLRGKRSVIFGNVEKLYDFHSQYFLKELESCCNHPLRVSHCFLRHKDQFGMYALYSKNKPKSDTLLASHGNTFFRKKQLQLGDKMDLASYLLKPIQRMSKYALLLKDLIKECSEAQEQELSYLRAAAEMVKFQLRHGNDLLAMDAIRDCDVNLKEQGQLVRQDEFTIILGRRKCQRHVFLFEDLILFSKPKRIDGGLDVYIYKHSYKTADIGLTENSGDSGLRFEIWFRRRKSSDTYILQAATPAIKQAWTSDIAKILWQQATRNKEIRMQEMVSMGVGNKPFMDIKPSEAAINDRAIDYIMKGRGARTRASIAVSLFDHSNPFKRTQTPISTSSTPSACGPPSSSSLLGPLNLHMYTNQSLLPGVLSSHPFDVSTCIEEDELEHETSSQPSMTTESSESSHCMSGSGSSGSDSGCVSNIMPESLSEETSSPCDPSTSYSLSGSRHRSIATSPVEEKTRFSNSQYISAKTDQITISPSTVV